MNVYRLWLGDAPGALGQADDDIPTLTDFGSPGSAAKGACVVCPGGGYGMLAPYEGGPVAEWFERIGVRGFVLKYRLGPRYHHPVMLHDAERAIRYLRSNAAKLGVDPVRIGVLGFSAGGHLASTVSTHFSTGVSLAADPLDQVTSRPDWSVLMYPVITMTGPFAHAGSRENLLGKDPAESATLDLSNERAVSLDTPPTFICHGADDAAVPIENSLQYATALAGHKVPFEIYVPQNGPHGYGLGTTGTQTDWPPLCERWLRDRKII
jgi:acetyl esterase/lipase